MTHLRFPVVAAPDVSVVVVVHNAWEWTRRALTALGCHTPPGYELILVDNASCDQTPQGLAAVEGATLIRNAHNRGFGPAANQGAALARGRYLVFLNSDALVHPGWLQALLEVVEDEADVAAVGARLLNLDGTLQEAGCIVWRGGEVTNFGDGDDAERPEYTFRRDVDYVSAACLLVRRSAFCEVGGFDPSYAPAYLEDVDLCFALADRGWRIVYQPQAKVTHVRWASGNRQTTRSLVARNRPRFVRRWQTALASRPVYPGCHTRRLLLAARDAACVERLLVVARGAAAGVGRELAWGLHRRVSRARVTVVGGGHDCAAEAALRSAGVEVVGVGDLAGWLQERRGHYTAAFVAEASEDLVPALTSYQPHAPVYLATRTSEGIAVRRSGWPLDPPVDLDQALRLAGLVLTTV